MSNYIMRRLIIAIPLLLAMSFVTFLIIHISQTDFFDRMKMDPQMSGETIERYKALYGLDKPVPIQYLYWLKNLAKFDLGYSFLYNAPVKTIIAKRLFNTFILSLSSLLFTWLIALPLGIYCAVNHGRFSDKILSFIAFFLLSIPAFFLAMLLLYIVSLTGILPLGGMRSASFESLNFMGKFFDILKHLIIPTVSVSLSGIAILQRKTRASMLDVLRQQYIIFARAKGLPENKVIYHHALRNAINPLVTIFGFSLSALLSGAGLVEIVCGWPGLGSVMLAAVQSWDKYLVMGGMLMGGMLLILGNLFADILLAKADPRIRYE